MKLSWLLVLLLLIFVAIFSVQNAEVITVRFLAWEFTLSAALLIQLAALLGAFVGIGIGLRSRRPAKPADEPEPFASRSAELPARTADLTKSADLPDDQR